MTITAPRPATPDAPASRSTRLLGLAVPGVLLSLCSVGVVSMLGTHDRIAQAIHLLVALH